MMARRSELPAKRQREIDGLWQRAKAASAKRLKLARELGESHPSVQQAWNDEQRLWDRAIPVGGY